MLFPAVSSFRLMAAMEGNRIGKNGTNDWKVDTFGQFEASDFHEAEISAKSPEKQLWTFAGECSKDPEHDMILYHVTSLQVITVFVLSPRANSRKNHAQTDQRKIARACKSSVLHLFAFLHVHTSSVSIYYANNSPLRCG